jgi:hypothetical protein
MRVTSAEIATAVGTSQADGSQLLAAHQRAIVTAEAQVPEPGCRYPIPKKVAIIQERRDLGAVFGDRIMVVGKRASLQKWVLDSELAEPMSVMHIFAIQNRALTLDCGGHDQRVVPGQTVSIFQSESLREERVRRLNSQQRLKDCVQILLCFSDSHGMGKFAQRYIEKFLNYLVAHNCLPRCNALKDEISGPFLFS